MDPIEKAFSKTPRTNFLPDSYGSSAEFDQPIPIGFGQTNSQPSTVRWMLEWLEVEPGNKVLDVGSGSGWTTALLSNLVGPTGQVYAVEIIPELVELGRQNCQRLGIENVHFHQAGEIHGLSKAAPYQRILVSAAADELPKDLLDQLCVDGKMVVPVRHDILEITKTAPDKYDTITHAGFAFVPLV